MRHYYSHSVNSENLNVSNHDKRYNIYQYLRNEFFNADAETFELIASFYRIHYGDSAYYYLKKTYSSWKKGSVGLSSLTMDRIIEIVPKFLIPSKRVFILRCELHNFLEKAKSKLKRLDLKLDNLHNVYKTLQLELVDFNEDNLKWFIGKNIFPAEHVDWYLSVCRYSLNERLIQSYKQTLKDLALIQAKFRNFNFEIENATYQIDFLNVALDVLQIKNHSLKFESLSQLDVNLGESFKKIGERYIVEELMKMSFYEKEGLNNSAIKSNDLDFIFAHFTELTKEKNEVKLTSTFQGEGGLLKLSLEYVPYKKIVFAIFIATIKIIAIFIGLVLGVLILWQLWDTLSFFILLLGGWVYFYYLVLILSEEIIKIRESITQFKKHGK